MFILENKILNWNITVKSMTSQRDSQILVSSEVLWSSMYIFDKIKLVFLYKTFAYIELNIYMSYTVHLIRNEILTGSSL